MATESQVPVNLNKFKKKKKSFLAEGTYKKRVAQTHAFCNDSVPSGYKLLASIKHDLEPPAGLPPRPAAPRQLSKKKGLNTEDPSLGSGVWVMRFSGLQIRGLAGFRNTLSWEVFRAERFKGQGVRIQRFLRNNDVCF